MPNVADLVVVNAKILTMDDGTPRAEALAVKDGRILAGRRSRRHRSAERIRHAGSIDAGGNSVVPGFVESHVHLLMGAAELGHLQLFGVHGFEALDKKVKAFAAANPDAAVLMAQGADYTILSEGRAADAASSRPHRR